MDFSPEHCFYLRLSYIYVLDHGGLHFFFLLFLCHFLLSFLPTPNIAGWQTLTTSKVLSVRWSPGSIFRPQFLKKINHDGFEMTAIFHQSMATIPATLTEAAHTSNLGGSMRIAGWSVGLISTACAIAATRRPHKLRGLPTSPVMTSVKKYGLLSSCVSRAPWRLSLDPANTDEDPGDAP